jgi:hypothetical protein
MSHRGVTRRLKTCGLLQVARAEARRLFPQMHMAKRVLGGHRCGVVGGIAPSRLEGQPFSR